MLDGAKRSTLHQGAQVIEAVFYSRVRVVFHEWMMRLECYNQLKFIMCTAAVHGNLLLRPAVTSARPSLICKDYVGIEAWSTLSQLHALLPGESV